MGVIIRIMYKLKFLLNGYCLIFLFIFLYEINNYLFNINFLLLYIFVFLEKEEICICKIDLFFFKNLKYLYCFFVVELDLKRKVYLLCFFI